MRCRHTVPDWHRYVESTENGSAIMAGCRLLVKEGERAHDPRSIACAYWRHQEQCPLYEGPGARRAPSQTLPADAASSADVPVDVETVWPVRSPTAPDGMRVLIIALGVLSVLLLCAAVFAFAGLRGPGGPGIPWGVMAAAAAVSIATHVLATLRLWARR